MIGFFFIYAVFMYVFHVVHGTTYIVLSVLFSLLALSHITMFIIRTESTKKLWGRNYSAIDLYVIMSECNKLSVNPYKIYSLIFPMIFIIIFVLSIFVEKKWFPLAFSALGLVLWHGSQRSLPPLALYLSTSVDSFSLHVHEMLSKATRPVFQTYSLIKLQDYQKGDINARVSNFRVLDDSKWGTVVVEFMDLAKIIVLDTRFVSQGAIEEAIRLAEKNFFYKILLIANKDGREPLIDALNENVSKSFIEVLRLPEEKAILLVKSIANNPKYLSSNHTTLSQIMHECNTN